jgi:glycosyltransferase involved in cell wall biosynthesis
MVDGRRETVPLAPIFAGEENADEEKLSAVKNKYGLPDKFILYLGTVEPRKNIDGIIRGYNELRTMNHELGDYKLVIAGGKGWKSKNIYKEWELSKFKDDIKFLGYIDSADRAYLYNLAAVFVYPSFYEGFGFPPLEAMACGLPVVASYASSLPEVAGEAALMVDPYNINDIARALTEILTDDNLRKKLIARGLEQAKKFSWQKTAEEYLEILSKL